ncbi:MAG TPA: T9SS type A sorting domain-containing protein, partial [Chitinophagales bacterium]|nr:T9SS type A sorting domain-containing protein [Chitinophagales bacterium]
KRILLLPVLMGLFAFANAQCNIDTTLLTAPGMYPSAQHLPHIVKDSLYDQTVQGLIPDTMSMNFGGFVDVSVRVDSVRLDTINGLPNGITWVKNPGVLPGGGYGCVEFSGTTSDTPGVYNIRAIGKIWAHLSIPLLGVNEDTSSYGSLQQMPQFNNYYLVVDSTGSALAVSIDGRNLCFGDSLTGRVTANATGGSPTSPYVYEWNTAANSYTINNVGTGTYSVTVTSGSETATASVVIAQEPTALTVTTGTNAGSTGNDGEAEVAIAGGVAPYSINWNNGESTDTISGLAPGTYRVTVIDSFGCMQRSTATVQDLTSGIATINGVTTTLTLYPNPTRTSLNVEIEVAQSATYVMSVFDLSGRELYKTTFTGNGKTYKLINTSQYSAGLYFLQLSSNGQGIRQRFVVER